MTYKVKTKQELEAIIDRGRCIICGDIGSGSSHGVIFCSPDCKALYWRLHHQKEE